MINDTLALASNPTQLADVLVVWGTVALAAATFFLAILNCRVIGEMKEARKTAERPGLYLWSVPDYVDDRSHERVHLNIQNGGKGPVEQAKAECWLKAKDVSHVYLTYDGPISFAPGEARIVECLRSPDSPKPPGDGDLVARLSWRGAKPWWDHWQASQEYVLSLEQMKRHRTKFASDTITFAGNT